ncbi:hypothetical protein NIES970_17480 [[Synechococcus] sp. NIES-970]|nr:hypothetical protein NIES970_17480 [[Synechococcus] sp. NIES-970]
MNKFESKPSPPKLNVNQGWVVQIYGRNRQLLWVLEPSHGWMFLIGCSIGLLLAVIWINLARHSPPPEATPIVEPPTLQVD